MTDESPPKSDKAASPPSSPEAEFIEQEQQEPAQPTDSPPAKGKKQLSEKQKASLAKARVKARETKLARTAAKKAHEEDLKAKMQQYEADLKKKQENEQESDTEMSNSPSPSPKKKPRKSHKKTKRARVESSESDSSPDKPSDAAERAKHHLGLAKAAYDVNMARYRNDVLYKNLFPYLGN